MNYEPVIFGMELVYYELSQNENGLCDIVYYFHEKMMGSEMKQDVKMISINGVTPNAQTIKNGTHPYASPVCAMIRSDLDKGSMAYKLYEWLQTGDGKRLIAESGYIPN